jgi:hypothetical protein
MLGTEGGKDKCDASALSNPPVNFLNGAGIPDAHLVELLSPTTLDAMLLISWKSSCVPLLLASRSSFASGSTQTFPANLPTTFTTRGWRQLITRPAHQWWWQRMRHHIATEHPRLSRRHLCSSPGSMLANQVQRRVNYGTQCDDAALVLSAGWTLCVPHQQSNNSR